jgi:hypothetical protein
MLQLVIKEIRSSPSLKAFPIHNGLLHRAFLRVGKHVMCLAREMVSLLRSHM